MGNIIIVMFDLLEKIIEILLDSSIASYSQKTALKIRRHNLQEAIEKTKEDDWK